jgi:signal transduction histidine kinase
VPRHDSGSATPDDDRRRPEVGRSGVAGWPIRRKLVALVALPLVVILAAGGVFAYQTARSYFGSRETRQLADLSAGAVDVTGAVTREYALSSSVTSKAPKVVGGALDQAQRRTDSTVKKLLAEIAQLRPKSLSAAADNAGQQLVDQLPNLVPQLRNQAAQSFSAVEQAGRYQTLLGLLSEYLRAVSNDIGSNSASQSEVNAAQTQNTMVQVGVAAAQERSLLAEGLQAHRISPEDNLQLQFLIATEGQNLDAAALFATPEQRDPLDALRGSTDDQLSGFRQDAAKLLSAGQGTAGDTAQGDAGTFERVAEARLDKIIALTTQVSQSLRDAAASTERTNLLRAIGAAALALLTLLVVGVLVVRLARSISVPLRLLRVGAGDAAHVNLPNAVAEIERNGPDAVVGLPAVLPPGSTAGPETMDVARAVDNLGAEAVRLAASQVRLRRTLDDAFVSMSRRSQSMVEKQLAIIDELESTEEDPDQLRNLFRLDHLAARMRRYNDNLLVLAGSTMRNRTTAPVRVAELFRAATSEMEQYERVRLQPVGGAAVAGNVAGELIHLLAELLDNAAMYSPPSSSIVLSAAFTSDGGVHLEVVDSGVGVPSDEIDRLNTRLARSETMDLQAASRIGLFVVARLARRGGFVVSLRQRPDANGTVAQVIVPPQVVIGAPGSTGEQPVVSTLAPAPSSNWLGPRTGPVPTIMPPAGVPTQPGQPGQAAAAAQAGQLSSLPPASATSASEAAAAKLGTAAEPGQAPADPQLLRGPNDPLPRRRRGAAVAGTPPADVRPPTASEGLFGPVDEDSVRNGQSPNPGVAAAFRHDHGPAGAGDGEPPDAGSADPSADPGAESSAGTPATEHPGSSPTDLPADPTTRRGTNGLPRRGGSAASTGWPVEDATARLPRVPDVTAGGLKQVSNPAVQPSGGEWADLLPTELAARTAAASSYQPANPDNPLIGSAPDGSMPGGTPIFDSISAWFGDGPATGEGPVIDVRDGEQPVVSRWDSLGDQRWLATSAKAAAEPDVAGHTTTGLPRRRPGANLLPSASATAPAATAPTVAPATAPTVAPAPGSPAGDPGTAPLPTRSSARASRATVPAGGGGERQTPGPRDAAAIRGRLGSYQRGLASARRARPEPSDDEFGTFDPVGASLFASGRDEQVEPENGQHAGEQGGDS